MAGIAISRLIIPLFMYPIAPETAVGTITGKGVARAISAGSPKHNFNIGVVISPPPMPKSPDVNPTKNPVRV